MIIELYDISSAGFIGLTSAVIGSFVGVIATRQDTKKLWWRGRSRCDHCDAPLGIPALIPIVGFCWHAGQSHCCGRRISNTYLVLELAALVGGISAWLMFDGLRLAAALCLLWLLLLVSAFDMITGFLPRAVNLVISLCGIGYAYLNNLLLDRLVAALLLGSLMASLRFLYRRLRARDGMGLGDIWLTAAGGTWVGLAGAGLLLCVASLSGLAYALLQRKQMHSRIRFAPALSLGIWIAFLFAGSGLSMDQV